MVAELIRDIVFYMISSRGTYAMKGIMPPESFGYFFTNKIL